MPVAQWVIGALRRRLRPSVCQPSPMPIHDIIAISATMERGMFSRVRGDVYCLAPPLVTSEETLDEVVEILADSTKAVLG